MVGGWKPQALNVYARPARGFEHTELLRKHNVSRSGLILVSLREELCASKVFAEAWKILVAERVPAAGEKDTPRGAPYCCRGATDQIKDFLSSCT